jgi:hypothetical protein
MPEINADSYGQSANLEGGRSHVTHAPKQASVMFFQDGADALETPAFCTFDTKRVGEGGDKV